MQRKENQGLTLTETEVAEYQQEEAAIYANDVIRKFLYAQREFSQMHSLISQYFTKTVELDRLPESNELKKAVAVAAEAAAVEGLIKEA